MVHSSFKGSEIAKSGFKNENFIKFEFNQWKTSVYAQQWLEEMEYDLKKIKKIEVKIGRETGRARQKSDIILNIDGKDEKISVKYSKGTVNYNQIGRGWVETFAKNWSMPQEIINIMKKYVGELNHQIEDYMSDLEIKELEKKRETYLSKKTLSVVRRQKRLCLLDFSEQERKLVLDFFDKNRELIARYLIQGKEFPTDWLLVVNHDEEKITKTKIVKISKFIEYIIKFPAMISSQGVLHAARITFQRKSGDPGAIHKESGREYAQQLQPKFHPNDIFELDD